MKKRKELKCFAAIDMEMVEDVLLLILLWLPVKSLLRFKAVCKSWRSIIESSAFISQHLHHHHHRQLDDQEDSWNFITLEPSQPGFSLLFGNNFQFSRNLEFQNELGIRPNIIASCDGIVCLKHGDYPDISLWNPATRQFITLPKPPQPLPFNRPVTLDYGFGFDLKTYDYKVVQIVIERTGEYTPFLLDTDGIPIPHSNVTTNVYSLSTNCWRTVDAVLPVVEIIHNPKFPLQNGIYYWVGAGYVNGGKRRLTDQIFYFDFTTEAFGTIPLPDVCANGKTLLVLGLIRDNIACIQMCDLVPTGVLHQIWVLNQYDANGSWTKLSTVTIKIASQLFGMSKNGMIFWKITYTSGRTIVYLSDPITQKKKILPVEGPSYDFQGAVYKESLVSVKGAVDASAT